MTGRGNNSIATTMLFAVALFATSAQAALDEKVAFAHSQSAVGRTLSAHQFIDTDGRPFSLAQLKSKPVVVSLVYTSCPSACSIISKRLEHAVSIAREALGAEAFSVISVGFDTAVDSPERMRSFARAQGVSQSNWRWLAADAATIETFTDELGFSFTPSPRGYDHLAQVTLLSGELEVYRQIYGETFEAPALVEPLKELIFANRPGTSTFDAWVDGIRLLCTVYDPATGRYGFDYSVFVAAGVGLLCLGWLAYFLVSTWLGQRRPRAT